MTHTESHPQFPVLHYPIQRQENQLNEIQQPTDSRDMDKINSLGQLYTITVHKHTHTGSQLTAYPLTPSPHMHHNVKAVQI